MKLNLKSIGKGLAAAGTLIGGTILALQTKKGLKEQEFDSTLEPLGEETEDDVFCEETEPEKEQEEETEE